MNEELICYEIHGERYCMWIPKDRLIPAWEMLLAMVEQGTAATA